MTYWNSTGSTWILKSGIHDLKELATLVREPMMSVVGRKLLSPMVEKMLCYTSKPAPWPIHLHKPPHGVDSTNLSTQWQTLTIFSSYG